MLYEGLDGVFEGIWTALEYPEYTVLILDEIDHVQHDSNYDPNDFFYRLLRSEGKLQRDLNLTVFLVSNELLEVDFRLDSRLQSAMDGEEVFFPPYGVDLLEQILRSRIERAFCEEQCPSPSSSMASESPLSGEMTSGRRSEYSGRPARLRWNRSWRR